MMRAIITTPTATMKTNGSTPQFIAVMKALSDSGRPLRVEEVGEGMDNAYVLTRNRNWKNEIRGILQRLIDAGAVYHPDVPGTSRLYCLSKDIKVEVSF